MRENEREEEKVRKWKQGGLGDQGMRERGGDESE